MSARELYYENLVDMPTSRQEGGYNLWKKLLDATMPKVVLRTDDDHDFPVFLEDVHYAGPAKKLVLVAPQGALEAEDARFAEMFNALAQAWKSEMILSSSLSKVAMNESYQRIIGFGPKALRHIFRDLRDHGGPWFWALRALTGEDPVPPEHRGNMQSMTEDWLNWGSQHGYL